MEKPIIFSTPMVRAILEGRKTQTRRVIKPQPGEHPNDDGYISSITNRCPYQPGDILWVREKWCNINKPKFEPEYYYFADIDSSIEDYDSKEWKWCTPIYMPRKAARIFPKVKNVMVERLQDITEEDAKAEGVEWLPEISAYKNYLWHGNRDIPLKLIDSWEYQYSGYKDARGSFSSLWQLINAKRGYGWNINPWVWVIEFEKV